MLADRAVCALSVAGPTAGCWPTVPLALSIAGLAA